MENFLSHAPVYLAAMVIAVPIAARLGLGSVLGYLAAGILIGPVLGFAGNETQEIQHFAEFGVIMMLFLIGLELEPRTLWAMRHQLLGLGGLQIIASAGLLGVAAYGMGQSVSVSVSVGLILALSSTAIILQTLSEKGLMRTKGGRASFSVLLTQDISVIPIIAVLPLLALSPSPRLGSDKANLHQGDINHSATHSLSLVDNLPGWATALISLTAIATIIFVGVYLSRPIFRYIHATNMREMYTALALLIVVGISACMNFIGLSPALGAFLAGVVLANSEFRHELEGDLEPFKGLLLGLFFITVGAGINTDLLMAQALDVISLALLVILSKGLVLFCIGWTFGLRRRALWLFTLCLAQAGEFGFVLLSLSQQLSVIPQDLAEKLLLIIALTMLITPALFILYDVLSKRIGDPQNVAAQDIVDDQGPIIIAGIGRFGQIVHRLVDASGLKTVLLDTDMQAVQLMRRFGYKSYLGDPTRPELLKAAGVDKARVLVVALDDRTEATKLVAHARRHYPDLHIVARAYDRGHVFELYKAGANDIVREMFDSSLRAGRYVLENAGFSEYDAAQAEQTFYQHDRTVLRELAPYWKPGVVTSENPEYVRRAQQLHRELEIALLERVSQKKDES